MFDSERRHVAQMSLAVYLYLCVHLSLHSKTIPLYTAESQRNALTALLRRLPIVPGLDQPLVGSLSHDTS